MSVQPSDEGSGAGFLTRYLLGTPLFVLLDIAFDAPVRVAALQHSNLRFGYYGFAFACGILAHARPALEPWVGMGESAVNILLLVLAVMVPIWSLPDALMANAPLVGPFDKVSLINFVISGTVLVVGFYGAQARSQAARARPPPRSLGV